MRICRVCGCDFFDHVIIAGYPLNKCRDCYNAQRRAAYQKRKNDTNEKRRADYAANVNGIRDKHHAAMKLKYSERGAAVREWWNDLPIDKKREIYRIKQARRRESLSDSYVKTLLNQHSKIRTEIPDSMVKAKRLQIQIERLCDEKC